EEKALNLKTELEPQFAKLTEEYQLIGQKISNEQAILNERRRNIPAELTTLPALEEKTKSVRKKKKNLERAWEQAQNFLQAKKEVFFRAESELYHLKKRLEELTEKSLQALQIFERQLERQQFA